MKAERLGWLVLVLAVWYVLGHVYAAMTGSSIPDALATVAGALIGLVAVSAAVLANVKP